MTIIAELEAAAEQARSERAQAEARERACDVAVEQACTAEAAAARRRVELADALARAQALEAAALERMGAARASVARTEREIEDRAARAADGDDAAAKAVARLQDSGGMQAAIVRAHENKARELAAAREAAEHALAAHDMAERARVGREIEGLMLVAAEVADAHLAIAARLALRAGALVDLRRSTPGPDGAAPSERWAIYYGAQNRHSAFLGAARLVAGPLEASFARIGQQHRGATLVSNVRQTIATWAWRPDDAGPGLAA